MKILLIIGAATGSDLLDPGVMQYDRINRCYSLRFQSHEGKWKGMM